MAMSGSAVRLGQATPDIAAGGGRMVQWVFPLPVAFIFHSPNLLCPHIAKPSHPCLTGTAVIRARYLMSIRHSLMRFATPRFREKFTCTFVGTGRNVRYAFLHILPILQPWWDFPGNYCWRELLLGTHGPSHELRGACGGSRSGQPPC